MYTRIVKVPVAARTATSVPAEPTATAAASSNSNEAQDPSTGVVVMASNLHHDSGGDMPPPDGQQFVVVHVVLTNNGRSSASYNALDFKLEGASDHVRYDADALDTNVTNTSLNSGNVAPGETVAGDLAFQVPASQDSFTLLWTPDFMGDAIPVPIS